MSKTKLAALLLLGVVGYVGWAVMVSQDAALRPDFLKLHVAAVTGVLALALRDMPPPPPPAPTIGVPS